MARIFAALLFVTAIHTLDALVVRSTEAEEEYRLPSGILVGAGVSALQTEGAWNEDGKAESATDWVINAMKWTVNQTVAADSYHRFRDDVQKAAELKLGLYKFSISWARVLPEADATKPNQLGVTFYNNLIDAIIENGMTPMVTMYHFDHPRILEDQFKGWQNSAMADKFAEYARFIFKTFGDRVKHWVTINEPNMYCAYFTAMFVAANLRKQEEVDPYQCIHNNLLAHLKAREVFKELKLEGKLGYSALLMYAEPHTTSPEDIYAASAFNELHAGSSIHPVVYGDYPQAFKNLVGAKLPQFTDEEKQQLIGSADFIGLNIYFGMEASFNRYNNASSGGVTSMVLGQMTKDIPFIDIAMAGGAASSPLSAFTTINPDVMRNALLWTHENYKIPIVITENGYGDVLGFGVHDNQRAAYHSAFLRTLVRTVENYNVSVLAYSAWSLIDSFEFSAGYSRPFGLVHIDYETGSLNRTLKDSAQFWISLKDTGCVPYVKPDESTTPSASSTTPVPSSCTRALGSLYVIVFAFLGFFASQ